MSISRYLDLRAVARRFIRELYLRANPGVPLLAISAIDFLEGWMKTSDSVLEYGSGHSTRWYAQRCASIVAVENIEKWAEIVRRETADCANVDLRLISGFQVGRGSPGGLGAHTDRPFEGPQVTEEYVQLTDQFPSRSFDLIVNDGWARHQVGLRSLRLVRPGGAIVWDDVNWHELQASQTPEVQSFVEVTQDWRRVNFSDGEHRTLVAFAPA